MYERLGGQDGIRALVDRFYDAIERLPEDAPLRAMHPRNLGESRRRLWMFLVGRLGGPPLYEQERGHPRLRARHLPFPVDRAAADAWVACMDEALLGVEDEADRAELAAFFRMVATHMIHLADGAPRE